MIAAALIGVIASLMVSCGPLVVSSLKDMGELCHVALIEYVYIADPANEHEAVSAPFNCTLHLFTEGIGELFVLRSDLLDHVRLDARSKGQFIFNIGDGGEGGFNLALVVRHGGLLLVMICAMDVTK